MINTRKRATETFIVARQGQSTMPTSGNINSSTFPNVNLAYGQLATVSDSIYGTVALNTITDATPTIAEAPVLAIYQGGEYAASMATATASSPLWVRPYERTNPINGKGTVRVTKQAYREPTHSVYVVGNTVGSTGEINVLDETTYSLSVALRGRRIQESHSIQEASVLHASVTSPNFTDLGYTDAQAVDWITTYMAWNINRNSQLLNLNTRFPANWPVLALLVNTVGATGTAIGGNAGGAPSTALAAGDVLPVLNTDTGLRNITLTEALASSIKNAAVAASGDAIGNVTWTIETIDLAEAGEVTLSRGEILMIIGLDERTAYVDYIPEVKTRVQVGLTAGFDFDTVQNLEAEFADEGQGQYRPLDLLYKATHGQRKYSLRHTEDPVINFPSPIVDGIGGYVVYNILHQNADHIDTFNTVVSPYREIICIPRYSTGTTTNPLIATFDGVLNNWLASTPTNGAIVSLD